VKFLWTGFGLGLSPVAPGTFGTLLGVAIAYFVPGPAWIPAVAITLLGVPLARMAERAHGKEDPGSFVLDEVAGYLVAVAWLPRTWPVLAGAFVAFRIFDIGKPLLIRRLERIGGGWGVMLDDVLAGVYANLAVRATLYVL